VVGEYGIISSLKGKGLAVCYNMGGPGGPVLSEISQTQRNKYYIFYEWMLM
jgi:hypothetical protein